MSLALAIAWPVLLIAAFVMYPITTLVVCVVGAALAVVLFWYWMHTYELHAHSPHPHAFMRLVWRKLRGDA